MEHNTHSQIFDFIIVGGGCIGVSTALALQKEIPGAKILLAEGYETRTASKHGSKIVRKAYYDQGYVTLATEADEKFNVDPLYSKFYRRTGWIQVVRGNDYKPFHSGEQLIDVEDLSTMNHLKSSSQIDPTEELWLNEDVGVVYSTLALEEIAIRAETLGVIRLRKDISKLITSDGICHGVECDGISFKANITIVATGAWTPALLKCSGIQLPHPLQDFLKITAIVVAKLYLTKEEYARFKSNRVLSTDQGMSQIIHLI